MISIMDRSKLLLQSNFSKFYSLQNNVSLWMLTWPCRADYIFLYKYPNQLRTLPVELSTFYDVYVLFEWKRKTHSLPTTVLFINRQVKDHCFEMSFDQSILNQWPGHEYDDLHCSYILNNFFHINPRCSLKNSDSTVMKLLTQDTIKKTYSVEDMTDRFKAKICSFFYGLKSQTFSKTVS